MTESYPTMKARHQKELDTLPIKWAFSDKQLIEALAELGLTIDDTHLLTRVPGGGFMRKTESHLLLEMFHRHEQELQTAIQADTSGTGFIFEMLDFELSNHEYCITHDVEPALDSLGLDMDDIEASTALQNGLKLALQEQRKNRP
jgi:hypothetical protein